MTAVLFLLGHQPTNFVRGFSVCSTRLNLVWATSLRTVSTTVASSLPSSPLRSSSLVSLAAHSTSNNLVDDQLDPRIPATGWNHNRPTSDKFWLSPNSNRTTGSTTSTTTTTTTASTSQESTVPTESLSTGWLHNTQPRHQLQESLTAASLQIPKPSSTNLAQLRLQQAMVQKERNHRIVSPPTLFGCQDDRGTMAITEHKLSVPLKYNTSTTTSALQQPQRIDIYFTIVEHVPDLGTADWFGTLTSMTPTQRAQAYVEHSALDSAESMILYLQGGPGFGAPVPVVDLGLSSDSSWAAKALTYYPRVVLMDQRGTGQSTPITKQRLERLFPDLFALDNDDTVQSGTSTSASTISAVNNDNDDTVKKANFDQALEQATDYLAQFRATSIVQDAEYIKDALMKPALSPTDFTATASTTTTTTSSSSNNKPNPWGAVLGQSFGGFCVSTYLSWVDHPPKVCLVTGGIPPIQASAQEVYTKLWDRVRERTQRYYDEYPGDVPVVQAIVQHLLKQPEPLGSGGVLTARRFLQYGMSLGGGPASFASLHHLLQTAFVDEEQTELSRSFGKYFEAHQPFDDNPLYYWLHESIYADGLDYSPTAWAAAKAHQELLEQNPSLDFANADNVDEPVVFFGEMVFPWMSEDYGECSGHGCTTLAHALANKTDWDPLYNPAHIRAMLAEGRSRMAAAVYYEDMYVEFDLCMRLTRRGGPLEGCKVYVTNEYQHSGIRNDGAKIFGKLHGMATGANRVPS